MRKNLQRTLSVFILFSLLFGIFPVYSADTTEQKIDSSFTENRTIDAGTFNAYRYKMTKEFFILRNSWDINRSMDIESLSRIGAISKESISYLPDNLINDNLSSKLYASVEKAKKDTKNSSYYADVVSKLEDYIDKVSIKSLKGSVEATPKEGNAPLNVTFRSTVSDPEGTVIPKYNYTWWMDVSGKRQVLGNGVSLNHTFTEEGKHSVFLDVVSSHKNKKGFTDVLPYRGKVDVVVKEKVASLILKINSENMANKDEVKFSPDDARYGLILDASSSTPTGGAKFTKTTWDFGNGQTKSYSGEPKIERVVYSKEGDYHVTLKLTTNLGTSITKEFDLLIHDPVASIISNPEEGFLGDKFTFSAKTSGRDDDKLTYYWEIVDIAKDKVIFEKQTKLFTYNFTEKGNFNVKLKTSGASSNEYDVDTKIIHINSRAPVAAFTSSIPKSNKPNTVLLNASDSYDLDFTDSGKLEFSWIIDGERVHLDNPNSNGSVGYYTFDSIGEHSVTLEVVDPDNIKGVKDSKVNIESILSVDFSALPIAVKLGDAITFKADSLEARIYEWDFGDTKKEGGVKSTIKHTYEKSGIYTVSLKVRDGSDNTNIVNNIVYVGDGNKPIAILTPKVKAGETPIVVKNACNGEDAYLASRAYPIEFDASKSINIDGSTSGLTYSLKVSDSKYLTSQNSSYKFDELGCFPVKLTVTSGKNGKTSTENIWIKVENQTPTLTGIVATATKIDTDPVIVNVSAVGAKDEDGVITSYLWYYYSDIDQEPQDFRSTTTPSTKFVLPKVTGNYYFVVVLTDDNEKKVSSSDLGRVSTLTLTGDNSNVPLVELKTPDNSVYIDEEVVFTANVKNILGKNISKESKYYWDFDGDGFYDSETSTPNITHKYDKSGEYFAKLKVKYKGFSNTRIVSVAVANKVVADFDYISLGNKIIFINKSTGSFSNISWNLGDGTKITGKNSFIYEYKDGKANHDVRLLVSETGGVAKTINKKVAKNMKNMLLAKKPGLTVFTNPSASKDDKIVLDSKVEKIYTYASAPEESIVKFAVDLDTETDSDLNGSKTDDKDMSVSKDDLISIKLDSKTANQKIKIFSINSDGVTIDEKIFTIEKNYLKDKDTIDLEKIVFKEVTDAEKEKIEYLKALVADLVPEIKTPSLEYLKRLQEEWGDSAEKTKIILEFEGFLDTTKLANKTEIIDTLESLLVQEDTDKSRKNISFNALKNLIPEKIECSFDIKQFKTCKSELVSKLEAIKNSNSIEISKKLSKEVLDVIANSKLMTVQEKLDFKAILGNLVYGETANIPKEEISQTTQENPDNSILSKIGSIFKVIFFIILALVLLIALFGFGYFAYYKATNKDPSVSFKTFVKNKISKKPIVQTNTTPDVTDILSGLAEEEKLEEEKEVDILDTPKQETKAKIENSDSGIPDWLKTASSSVETEQTVVTQDDDVFKTPDIEIKQEEAIDTQTPDLFQNKEEETKDIFSEIPVAIEQKVLETPVIKEEQTIEMPDTSLKPKDKIPDWLKDSFIETPVENPAETDKDITTADLISEEDSTKIDTSLENSENIDNSENLKQYTENIEDINLEESLKNIENTEVKTEEIPVAQISDDDLPDWLKTDFSSDKTEVKEDVKQDLKTKENESEIFTETKTEVKEEKEKKEEKKVEKIQESAEFESKKEAQTQKTAEIKEELKIEVKTEKKAKKKKKFVKKPSSQEEKKSELEKDKQKTITDKKGIKADKTVQKKSASDDLWDDGMDIPDWLKSDDEK